MKPTLLALAAVVATGCDLYVEEGPPPGPSMPQYQLVPRGNIAAVGNIVAVAWDGSQHWLVTREEMGDYWSPDRLEVFRFDAATGTASPPIVLTDHWEAPTGAVWLQDRLWIHYDANNAGLVTTLDPVTGVEEPQWRVGAGHRDIDSDGTSLFLGQADVSATIEVRDLATGAIVDEWWSESFQSSLRGVGVVTPPGAAAPEVWGGTQASNELAILVDREQVARAVVPQFDPGANLTPLLQFTGQGLTLLAFNQLYFYDVVR